MLPSIQTLRKENIVPAAKTLANAFTEDPANRWIFGSSEKSYKGLFELNKVFLKTGVGSLHIRHHDHLKSVLIAQSPHKNVSNWGMISNGLLAIPFKIGFGPFGRFMGVVNYFDKLRLELMNEPHWYLMAIGVNPNDQGGGLGTALIADTLEKIDQDHLASYLETASSRNLSLYEKFGFEILKELELPKGGPKVWAMRRPAQ